MSVLEARQLRLGSLNIGCPMRHAYVQQLPNLIRSEEYSSDPGGRRVCIRIRTNEEGVEILGDSARPVVLEQLLAELGAEEIEQVLCG